MAILSQSVASDLKTELVNRSYDVSIAPGEQFYKDDKLYLSMDTYAGNLLGVSHETHAGKFDPSDSAFVRAFLPIELKYWLTAHVQYVNHVFSTVGSDRVCTLTVGEEEFTGAQAIGALSNADADIEAFGQAVIALLQYENFDDLRN